MPLISPSEFPELYQQETTKTVIRSSEPAEGASLDLSDPSRPFVRYGTKAHAEYKEIVLCAWSLGFCPEEFDYRALALLRDHGIKIYLWDGTKAALKNPSIQPLHKIIPANSASVKICLGEMNLRADNYFILDEQAKYKLWPKLSPHLMLEYNNDASVLDLKALSADQRGWVLSNLSDGANGIKELILDTYTPEEKNQDPIIPRAMDNLQSLTIINPNPGQEIYCKPPTTLHTLHIKGVFGKDGSSSCSKNQQILEKGDTYWRIISPASLSNLRLEKIICQSNLVLPPTEALDLIECDITRIQLAAELTDLKFTNMGNIDGSLPGTALKSLSFSQCDLSGLNIEGIIERQRSLEKLAFDSCSNFSKLSLPVNTELRVLCISSFNDGLEAFELENINASKLEDINISVPLSSPISELIARARLTHCKIHCRSHELYDVLHALRNSRESLEDLSINIANELLVPNDQGINFSNFPRLRSLLLFHKAKSKLDTLIEFDGCPNLEFLTLSNHFNIIFKEEPRALRELSISNNTPILTPALFPTVGKLTFTSNDPFGVSLPILLTQFPALNYLILTAKKIAPMISTYPSLKRLHLTSLDPSQSFDIEHYFPNLSYYFTNMSISGSHPNLRQLFTNPQTQWESGLELMLPALSELIANPTMPTAHYQQLPSTLRSLTIEHDFPIDIPFSRFSGLTYLELTIQTPKTNRHISRLDFPQLYALEINADDQVTINTIPLTIKAPLLKEFRLSNPAGNISLVWEEPLPSLTTLSFTSMILLELLLLLLNSSTDTLKTLELNNDADEDVDPDDDDDEDQEQNTFNKKKYGDLVPQIAAAIFNILYLTKLNISRDLIGHLLNLDKSSIKTMAYLREANGLYRSPTMPFLPEDISPPPQNSASSVSGLDDETYMDPSDSIQYPNTLFFKHQKNWQAVPLDDEKYYLQRLELDPTGPVFLPDFLDNFTPIAQTDRSNHPEISMAENNANLLCVLNGEERGIHPIPVTGHQIMRWTTTKGQARLFQKAGRLLLEVDQDGPFEVRVYFNLDVEPVHHHTREAHFLPLQITELLFKLFNATENQQIQDTRFGKFFNNLSAGNRQAINEYLFNMTPFTVLGNFEAPDLQALQSIPLNTWRKHPYFHIDLFNKIKNITLPDTRSVRFLPQEVWFLVDLIEHARTTPIPPLSVNTFHSEAFNSVSSIRAPYQQPITFPIMPYHKTIFLEFVITFCRGFANEALDKAIPLPFNCLPSLETTLKILLHQKGVCRHRARIGVFLLRFFGIPSQLVIKPHHEQVLYYNDSNNQWLEVDLGGAEVNIIPNTTLMPAPYLAPVNLETLDPIPTLLEPTEQPELLSSIKALQPWFQQNNPAELTLQHLSVWLVPETHRIAITQKFIALASQAGRSCVYLSSPDDLTGQWVRMILKEHQFQTCPGPLQNIFNQGGILLIDISEFSPTEIASFKSVFEGFYRRTKAHEALTIIVLSTPDAWSAVSEAVTSRLLPPYDIKDLLVNLDQSEPMSLDHDVEDVEIDLYFLPIASQLLLPKYTYVDGGISIEDEGLLVKILQSKTHLIISNPDQETKKFLLKIEAEGGYLGPTGIFHPYTKGQISYKIAPLITTKVSPFQEKEASPVIFLTEKDILQMGISPCKINPQGQLVLFKSPIKTWPKDASLVLNVPIPTALLCYLQNELSTHRPDINLMLAPGLEQTQEGIIGNSQLVNNPFGITNIDIDRINILPNAWIQTTEPMACILHFQIPVESIIFIPKGADIATWVHRLEPTDNPLYFGSEQKIIMEALLENPYLPCILVLEGPISASLEALLSTILSTQKITLPLMLDETPVNKSLTILSPYHSALCPVTRLEIPPLIGSPRPFYWVKEATLEELLLTKSFHSPVFSNLEDWVKASGPKTLCINVDGLPDDWVLFKALRFGASFIIYQGKKFKLPSDIKNEIIFIGDDPTSNDSLRTFLNESCNILTIEKNAVKDGLIHLIVPYINQESPEDKNNILNICNGFLSQLIAEALSLPSRWQMESLLLYYQAIKHLSPESMPMFIKAFWQTLNSFFNSTHKTIFLNHCLQFFHGYEDINLLEQDLDLPPIAASLILPNFILTDVHRLPLSYIDIALRRRHIQLNILSSLQGQLALLIEGPSGVGKSTMLIKYLTHLGIPFIFLVAGQPDTNARLLEAFEKGEVVVVDELNLDEPLMQLLSVILRGINPQGQPPKEKGFLLFASQNPSFFEGCRRLPQSLDGLIQIVKIGHYDEAVLVDIAIKLGASVDLAPILVQAYLSTIENLPQPINPRPFFYALERYLTSLSQTNLPMDTRKEDKDTETRLSSLQPGFFNAKGRGKRPRDPEDAKQRKRAKNTAI